MAPAAAGTDWRIEADIEAGRAAAWKEEQEKVGRSARAGWSAKTGVPGGAEVGPAALEQPGQPNLAGLAGVGLVLGPDPSLG